METIAGTIVGGIAGCGIGWMLASLTIVFCERYGIGPWAMNKPVSVPTMFPDLSLSSISGTYTDVVGTTKLSLRGNIVTCEFVMKDHYAAMLLFDKVTHDLSRGGTTMNIRDVETTQH